MDSIPVSSFESFPQTISSPPGFSQPEVPPSQPFIQQSAPTLFLPPEVAGIPIDYNIFGYFGGQIPVPPFPNNMNQVY